MENLVLSSLVDLPDLALPDLRKAATALLDEYWEFHRSYNQSCTPSEYDQKSILGCHLTSREAPYFGIEWYWNRWTKVNGKAKPLSVYIRKGQGFRYPSRSLQKYAKPWEVERVLHIEAQFAVIREQVNIIRRIAYYTRRFEKTLHKTAVLTSPPDSLSVGTGA